MAKLAGQKCTILIVDADSLATAGAPVDRLSVFVQFLLEGISKSVVDFARSPIRLKDKRNSGESHYEASMNLGFEMSSTEKRSP